MHWTRSRLAIVVGLSYGNILFVVYFMLYKNSLDTQINLKRDHEMDQKREDYSEDTSLLYRVDVQAELETSLEGGPGDYLKHYKNPCWLSKLESSYPYSDNLYKKLNIWEKFGSSEMYSVRKTMMDIYHVYANRTLHGEYWRLRCLPYVYLAGVTKSGTTDLFDSLTQHPDVVPGALKEPFWWNRRTIGGKRLWDATPFPFRDYIDLYDKTAETIRKDVRLMNNKVQHPKITIDGTPGYLWDYDGWQMIPGNMGLKEPRYILPHSIGALTPDAKIIVILRNPVDRWYSQVQKYNLDEGVLHISVEEIIRAMNECLEDHTLRECVYGPFPNCDPTKVMDWNLIKSFKASIYYVFISDWLSVFPRDQIFILHAEEDYFLNRTRALERMIEFLDLAPLAESKLRENSNRIISNKRSDGVPLSDETRELLGRFFEPYNIKLSELLNDERYKFWNEIYDFVYA